MPNPAALRERRLRKTKTQLIDEIDTLEQRAAALEAANRSSAPVRAKAEAAVRESQNLLQTILDNLPVTVFLRDRNGRFIMINKRYEEVELVEREGVTRPGNGAVFQVFRTQADEATDDP